MVRRTIVTALLGLTAWVAAAHVWVHAAGGPVHVDVATVPAREVVIVPGARVDADGAPSWLLARRLDGALALYRAGKAKKILVSGDHAQAAYDETNAMRRYLVARGVPDADVFMDHAGLRTRDTMERARRVFGATAVIVCTQGLHARRTSFLGRDAGLEVDVLEVAGDEWMSLAAHVRERLATVVAAWDALVDTAPHHLGPPIDLAGDGRQTHDATTRRAARTEAP
ncbi:MAG: YdcF family protein [Deltaproteobacteria bacterium]|nr:YdcF family protein [Deltaproteobacteria bacterium]